MIFTLDWIIYHLKLLTHQIAIAEKISNRWLLCNNKSHNYTEHAQSGFIATVSGKCLILITLLVGERINNIYFMFQEEEVKQYLV